MDIIRIATPEEIEKIANDSDLTMASSVLTFGKDHAVLKQVTEVDPMFWDEGTSHQKKALFVWGIENILRFQGVREYYFNVHCTDEDYQKIVEKWGAQRVSTAPEYRYKKNL